jgi:hypothetical protein
MPTNKFEYTFVVIADNLTPVIPILACSTINLDLVRSGG